MAVGDQIGDDGLIANLAFLTFQPVAGVECMIVKTISGSFLNAIPNRAYNIYTYMTNGVIQSLIASCDDNPISFNRMKLLVNNTNYLTIQNRGVGNQFLAFTGIQIK